MAGPLILDANLLGAVPSPIDARDFEILPLLDMAAPMPKRYIATGLGPNLDQSGCANGCPVHGDVGRCVAFAGTGMKQWQEKGDGHGVVKFDAQWLYAQAQAIDGISGPHSGTTWRAVLTVLLKLGEPVMGQPGTAGVSRIAAYYSVATDIEIRKRALMQFGPLAIATGWWSNQFYPVNGFLPRPTGARAGGHARLEFGWDDTVRSPFAQRAGVWYRRNSWRRSWGRNGNSLDAYEFDDQMDLHDVWKATDVKGD